MYSTQEEYTIETLQKWNDQLRAYARNLAEQNKELEQKLAAKSWLKRFMAWLDRNFN